LEKEVSAAKPPSCVHVDTLPFNKTAIVRRILAWYRLHGRQLPWRQSRDPYAIWVSEIMLQQTQVATVIPYYLAFLERFPTVTALANAHPDQVIKCWENLGYYHRARLMHRAAKLMAEKWDGKLPSHQDDLIRMPGIGPYAAGAIGSIAFGRRVLALDGNAKRVYVRLFAYEKRIDGKAGEAVIRRMAQPLLPASCPGIFNQAIMDLGATLCTPRRPSCTICPLKDYCLAFAKGLQDRLPIPKKKRALPHKDMTASVITDKTGKVLIVKRPEHGLLPGLWKFPGGELNGEGSLLEALEMRVLEELGVTVRVLGPITSVKHTFTHFRMTLHAFRARIRRGRPKPVTCAGLAWVRPEDLLDFAFSKADRQIVHHLLSSSENQG
jgi:A/G-specific adenine glycosylase